MIDLDKKELLTLYFYLSDKKDLSEKIDDILIKIEKRIFDSFIVQDIEAYRKTYNDKGKI